MKNSSTWNQATFATHPWMLADATNNSCVFLLPDAELGGSITLNGIGKEECDTTGFGSNCSNLDADIETLGLSDSEMNDIVDFMKSFTDDRVRYNRAPFDHPSLLIPNAHPDPITNRGDGTAPDNALLLAAVGRNGFSVQTPGFLEPLNSTLTVATPPQYEIWSICAQENSFCAFSGTKKVRFGGNSSFVTKTLTGGTLCDATTFGSDPVPSQVKQCQVSDASVSVGSGPQWTACSDENGFCAFAGTTSVRYGANGLYSTRTITDGTDCNNAVFGDPAPTAAKRCEYDASQLTAAPWTFCANEYETCAVPGTKTVRFGANNRYTTKTVTTSTPCDASVFGDPAPGALKTCEYQ